MSESYKSINALQDKLNQSVVGQEHVVRALIIALLSDGHVLLEGLPGTAKTRSVKALADNLELSFGRIQFTPDLLPSDVTGTEVYREIDGKPDLSFKEGPIFNSIVLADEINRAPAKVQAALLEAMAEQTITAAGETLLLPKPFMVLATQNPVEQEGTYPLPEAQMDRFLMKVEVFYPSAVAELDIIRLVRAEEKQSQDDIAREEKQVKHDVAAILEGKEAVKQIHVSEVVEQYIVDLIIATRSPQLYLDSDLDKLIAVGASPRASIALDRCSRASAWLAGRDYVTPDDVRSVVHEVLAHRITLTFDALANNISSYEVVDKLLEQVVLG